MRITDARTSLVSLRLSLIGLPPHTRTMLFPLQTKVPKEKGVKTILVPFLLLNTRCKCPGYSIQGWKLNSSGLVIIFSYVSGFHCFQLGDGVSENYQAIPSTCKLSTCKSSHPLGIVGVHSYYPLSKGGEIVSTQSQLLLY